MYEGIDEVMDDICGILIMVKAVYDATGEVIESILDSDYFWDVYTQAIDSAANVVAWGTINDYENVNKYSFPCMDEYYELCRKYGRIHRVSFENNPYVKNANEKIESEMNSIYSYYFDWTLFTPKKKTKKKYNCLWVMTYPEFNQLVTLVKALCSIRTFYEEGVEELKKVLEPAKPQIRLLPQKKERKKAA